MDYRLLVVYFFIGGAVVSSITYLGSQSKSLLAAFIAFLPSISVITLITIYTARGTDAALSYAKGMLMLLPPWVLYVLAVIFLLPRIGLLGSLLASVSIYLLTAFIVMKLAA